MDELTVTLKMSDWLKVLAALEVADGDAYGNLCDSQLADRYAAIRSRIAAQVATEEGPVTCR